MLINVDFAPDVTKNEMCDIGACAVDLLWLTASKQQPWKG